MSEINSEASDFRLASESFAHKNSFTKKHISFLKIYPAVEKNAFITLS
jgi:hypothetical protein